MCGANHREKLQQLQLSLQIQLEQTLKREAHMAEIQHVLQHHQHVLASKQQQLSQKQQLRANIIGAGATGECVAPLNMLIEKLQREIRELQTAESCHTICQDNLTSDMIRHDIHEVQQKLIECDAAIAKSRAHQQMIATGMNSHTCNHF